MCLNGASSTKRQHIRTSKDSRPIDTHRNAKPLQRLRLIRRHDMSNSVAPDTLQPLSVCVPGQLVPWVVVLRLDRVARVSEDTRPLLDALVERCDIERGVDVAMVDLHPGVLA